MYPPRRSDHSSKSRNSSQSGYLSPNKIQSKTNKVLENAKKYEQGKQTKRDYMLEGIMSIKKKQSDGDLHTNRAISRGSDNNHPNDQASSNNSNNKDIYRKVETYDKQNQLQEYPNQQRTMPNKSNSFLERQTNKQTRELLSQDKNNEFYGYRNQNPMTRETDFGKGQNFGFRQVQGERQVDARYSRQVREHKEQLNQNSDIYGKSYKEAPNNYSQRYQNNYQSTQTSNPISQPIQSSQIKRQQSFSSYQQSETKYQPPVPTQNINQNILKSTIVTQANSPGPQSYSMTSKPELSTVKSTPSLQQHKVQQQNLQKYNVASSEEQRKNLAIKNYKDKEYLSKLQSGEIQNDQQQIIKTQMEKVSRQATEFRNKYYKAEDERAVLQQKVRALQQENSHLRNQNEQINFKLKNSQFQLSSLQSYKQTTQSKMRNNKNSKEAVYEDLMVKINQLNIENRNKSFEITKMERLNSELQSEVSEKTYQLKRLKDVANKKEEEVLNLHQKQYQINKQNQANNRTEAQLKNQIQKIQSLQSEIKTFKSQKSHLLQLQSESSKNRTQIMQMLEDMKDLETQLAEKDTLIKQYKSMENKEQQNIRVRMIEQQLESVMRQKNELIRGYQQKLLDKEHQIQQIETKRFQVSNISGMRLGGIEAGEAAFQQILQKQQEEINSLKRQISSKVSEIFTLKIQIQNLKYELQNETNKSKIFSIQLESNQRNAQSISDSHLQAAKSEIDSLNRRIQLMNKTIQSRRKQNQNKDEFIQQCLIGNNKEKDVAILMRELDRILTKQN